MYSAVSICNQFMDGYFNFVCHWRVVPPHSNTLTHTHTLTFFSCPIQEDLQTWYMEHNNQNQFVGARVCWGLFHPTSCVSSFLPNTPFFFHSRRSRTYFVSAAEPHSTHTHTELDKWTDADKFSTRVYSCSSTTYLRYIHCDGVVPSLGKDQC